MHSPEAADHNLAVRSFEAVTTCWPSGENTANQTESRCPARVRMHSPEAADHTLAVRSREAVSICWPYAENTAERTKSV